MIEALFSNLYSIVGALVLACFGAYFAWRNGRKARVAAASAVFRSAFADTLLNLKHNDVATATVVREMHTRHLAAIEAFRPYVGRFGRPSFDASAIEYIQRANAYSKQGPLVQFASEQGTHAQAQRGALRGSIENLLNHAAAI